MKISGGSNYIIFDLENGYVVKAEGEMLVGGRFVVYKDTMNKWEAPHDNEIFTADNLEEIINSVNRITTEKSVQIIFE